MLYENKVSSAGERGGGCGSWIVRVNVFMKERRSKEGAQGKVLFAAAFNAAAKYATTFD